MSDSLNADPLARSRGRLDQIELQAIKQFTDDFHDSGCQFPHGGACACGWNSVQARIEELGGANPERVAYLRGSVRDLNDEARERVEETLAQVEAVLAVERPRPPLQEWQPIETAPKDRLILGALVTDGTIWRVHEMKHNGLAFYTKAGGSLPRMTHWTEMPEGADVTRPRRPLDDQET